MKQQPPQDGMAAAESLYGVEDGLQTDSKVASPPENNKVLVLEYSPSQGCFHIEELQASARGNLAALLAGRLTDYVLIAISSDRFALDRIADKLRKQLPDE